MESVGEKMAALKMRLMGKPNGKGRARRANRVGKSRRVMPARKAHARKSTRKIRH
jgi:hypothetical protein